MTEVAELSREDEMNQCISDLHKDARGFRPRGEYFWNTWQNATLAQKEEIWNGLVAELEFNNVQERLANERIAAEFERNIIATINAGAGDRQTALRWMFQDAEDLEHEIWSQNLLFIGNYEKEIKEAVGVAA